MTETTKRIIELKNARGVNDRQLELGANLPVSSIQHWTKGKKSKNGKIIEVNPSSEAIIKLAKYFDVTTDYLLGLSDDDSLKNFNQNGNQVIDGKDVHINENSFNGDSITKNEIDQKAIQAYLSLSEEKKSRARAHLENLATDFYMGNLDEVDKFVKEFGDIVGNYYFKVLIKLVKAMPIDEWSEWITALIKDLKAKGYDLDKILR